MNNAIHAEHLIKTYPGSVRALDDLSISVEAGTVFGLLGPNGAGKSTTTKVLTTLTQPDSGTAAVAGFDVRTQPQRVREVIGVVAQRSGVDPQITGRENLTLQGQLYGLRGQNLRSRVEELLNRFGLDNAADRLAISYSGGMQRRLDIAMGLVHRPRVLFLDEPTTGLDPEVRAQLWDEIQKLSTGEGLTVLLTTHYLDEADRLADRLAIVDRGRVVVEGTAESLKNELHGDALHIELKTTEDEKRVQQALAPMGEIRELSVNGQSLHARAENGAKAVPLVLQALQHNGIEAMAVTIARPSLDDVYLRHTGRTFQQADREISTGRPGGRS